jgi:hypothetical protein
MQDLFNLLFDKYSLKLTAVLDWDFAHIAHSISEFFHSFADLHAYFGPKSDKADDEALLRDSILTTFPDPLPGSDVPLDAKQASDEPRVTRWKLASQFNDCLVEAGVLKPSNIPGAAGWADIWWFTQHVCPWFFLQPRQVEKLGPEKALNKRQKADEKLDKQLKEWGV